MTAEPTVSIAVPVYQGEAFLEETLRAIQLQSYPEIEVMISLDGPQPDCEEICRPFLDDPRFRLVVQPERLGWVGNLNWLISQANTPFWYLNPQDDLVDSRYVQTLLGHSQHYPRAAVIYCDIQSFGQKNGTIIQSSVVGNALTRQLTLTLSHLAAVAFRGLTRVQALRHAGTIPSNKIDDFAVDTVWMAAMARWGDLVRVPQELYQKRYHDHNEHLKWLDWSPEKRTKAWMIHCVDMLEQAMLIKAVPGESRLLWLAGIERLLARNFGFLPRSDLQSEEKLSLYKDFLDYLMESDRIDIQGLLNSDWENIQSWTASVYWPGLEDL